MHNLTDDIPVPELAKVLPPSAAERLQAAARTPIPVWNPQARVIAVEDAIARARFENPGLFRRDGL